jgi:hypothetical protein
VVSVANDACNEDVCIVTAGLAGKRCFIRRLRRYRSRVSIICRSLFTRDLRRGHRKS